MRGISRIEQIIQVTECSICNKQTLLADLRVIGDISLHTQTALNLEIARRDALRQALDILQECDIEILVTQLMERREGNS